MSCHNRISGGTTKYKDAHLDLNSWDLFTRNDLFCLFTWGVLDRLLEESWLRIDAISGTSAGVMNAAVLADGWTEVDVVARPYRRLRTIL